MNSGSLAEGPVRVLLVMHGAGGGGVETSLGTLCKYLDRKRVQMTVVVPDEGPFCERVRKTGAEVVTTPVEWWTPAKWEYGNRHYYRFLSGVEERVQKISKIIQERDIEVVHSATLTVIDGALGAWRCSRPHIWNIRGMFDASEGTSFGVYVPIETVYEVVDVLSSRIVANSHAVKQFLLQYLPCQRVEVIQNGVDLERFHGDTVGACNLEGEYDVLKRKRKVALVGRVSPVKGIEDFAYAAVKVGSLHKDVAFLVVGTVEDEALLGRAQAIARAGGLKDRLIFTGRREDVAALLREIDILVCASIGEGLPNSCLEAMAASKPVVATRCGGAEEVVRHGENGYLTPVGSPAELADALLMALDSPEECRRMGSLGRQRVVREFSADANARCYEGLYRSLRDGIGLTNPYRRVWTDIGLHLGSRLGSLGAVSVEFERELRDLRALEARMKANPLFRLGKFLFRRGNG